MTERRTTVDWFFWLWWVLANVLAWPLGAAAGWTAGEQVARWLGPTAGSLTGMAIVGAIVGLGQWIVLRVRTSESGWWIPASSLGLVGGAATASVAFDWDPAGFITVFGLVGALVGIAQWIVLRRHVSSAGWWVPGTCLGYIAAILASAWLGGLLSFSTPVTFVLISVALGVVFGVISGVLLAGLLGAVRGPH